VRIHDRNRREILNAELRTASVWQRLANLSPEPVRAGVWKTRIGMGVSWQIAASSCGAKANARIHGHRQTRRRLCDQLQQAVAKKLHRTYDGQYAVYKT
jgi:hypothetical protein